MSDVPKDVWRVRLPKCYNKRNSKCESTNNNTGTINTADNTSDVEPHWVPQYFMLTLKISLETKGYELAFKYDIIIWAFRKLCPQFIFPETTTDTCGAITVLDRLSLLFFLSFF